MDPETLIKKEENIIEPYQFPEKFAFICICCYTVTRCLSIVFAVYGVYTQDKNILVLAVHFIQLSILILVGGFIVFIVLHRIRRVWFTPSSPLPSSLLKE